MRSRSRSPEDSFIPLQKTQEPALEMPPWVTTSTLQIEDPLLRLHEELIDFFNYTTPSADTVSKEHAVLSQLNSVAKSIWPQSEIMNVFYSHWESSSDLTLVVHTEDPEVLEAFAQKLLQMRLVSELERIDSAAMLRIKDKTTGLLVELACNESAILEEVSIFQKYSKRYPEVKYLHCVFKHFLKQRGLLDWSNGGISNLMLFCMVVASVQHHPAHRRKRKDYSSYTLAHYTLFFLELYGDLFNYEQVGISIKGDGAFFVKVKDSESRADLLAIEHPIKPEKDLGKTAFKVDFARKAFAHAYKLLCAQDYTCSKTLLQALIRTDPCQACQ